MSQVILGVLFLILLPFNIGYTEEKLPIEILSEQLKGVCLAPSESGKYWEVKIEGKGEAKLKLLIPLGPKVRGSINFMQGEWKGIQQILKEQRAGEHSDYRECIKNLSPLFMNKFFSKAREAEKEACVSFSGSPEKTKELALAAAKKQALSEFYGELVYSGSQSKGFILDPSLFSSEAIGIVRVQGSPRFYNGKSLGEVCVRTTFFITNEDVKQVHPQTAQLDKFCFSNEALPLPELIKTFPLFAQREGLSRVNPALKNASGDVVTKLATNFKVENRQIHFTTNALCGDASFRIAREIAVAFIPE